MNADVDEPISLFAQASREVTLAHMKLWACNRQIEDAKMRHDTKGIRKAMKSWGKLWDAVSIAREKRAQICAQKHYRLDALGFHRKHSR